MSLGAKLSNITKQDIVLEVARATGFIQADIRGVLEEFLSTVAISLNQNKNIEIRGFGTFSTKERKPRPARNPKTGEVVQLDQRRVPMFKFSSELKELINQKGSPAIYINTPQDKVTNS
jgi:DNA-binding protein HU-beta/integration host factor subunit beta